MESDLQGYQACTTFLITYSHGNIEKVQTVKDYTTKHNRIMEKFKNFTSGY